MSFDQILGGCIAVIVAGMPAMIALIKLQQLHVLINSRLTQLLEMASSSGRAEGEAIGRASSQLSVESFRLMQLQLDRILCRINEMDTRLDTLTLDRSRESTSSPQK